MLNIALPKGRLGQKVYAALEAIGKGCGDIFGESRKLIFENADAGVRYFLVKPSDVAIYVELGAADIGVVGKDILLENDPDVYELADLGIGKCKMAVAAKCGYREDMSRPVRIATKFTKIAKDYFDAKNRECEIIKLYGSIELAPILDISDVIVDIVETGTTLKENNLEVIEDIVPISARLIANKTSHKFKLAEIEGIADNLNKS